MEKILMNDYAEIKYIPAIGAVAIKWLPGSLQMSGWEFREQLDTLFSASEVFKAGKMFIDAFDFNYPVKEDTVRLINSYITNCPVKTFGIVKSRYLIREADLLNLLDKLNLDSCDVKVFDNRETGEFWFNLFSIMNEIKNKETD